MGAPRQGVVEGVEEESVMTVGTGHSAHAWDIGHWGGGRGGGRQVDDPLTVRSWASNSLTAALADEKTVARAAHVLPPWGRVTDRGGLIARVAFNNMLILLPGDVYHGTADPAAHHGHAPGEGVVGRRELIRSDRRHRGGGVGASIRPIELHGCSRVRSQQGLPLNIFSHLYRPVIGLCTAV